MKNKKALELSLQTVVTLIILVVVLIVVVFFFISHWGENFDSLRGLGNSAINASRK